MRIQKLTIVSLLVAMCFIGANIKLMGSIAFDAALPTKWKKKYNES